MEHIYQVHLYLRLPELQSVTIFNIFKLFETSIFQIKIYLNNYLDYNQSIYYGQSYKCALCFSLHFCSIQITLLRKIDKKAAKITQFTRRSILFSCIRMMTMFFVTYQHTNQCVFVLIFANDFPHLTLFYIKGKHHTSYNILLTKGQMCAQYETYCPIKRCFSAYFPS